MATRSQSLAKRYASLRSAGFRSSTGNSSSASSIARKVQSAQDKIIDDNYSNGLIDYQTYIRALQDRSLRAGSTPLQRENLRIKMRDVQASYEDNAVQTAYKTGGTYNGQKVDDVFLYNWEKNKLSSMDQSSSAYQTQLAKVQGLKDRAERQSRADYRANEELRISKMTDTNAEVIRSKRDLYTKLAEQAMQDGDELQATRFQTQANNYTEALKIAESNAKAKLAERQLQQQYIDKARQADMSQANTTPSPAPMPTPEQPAVSIPDNASNDQIATAQVEDLMNLDFTNIDILDTKMNDQERARLQSLTDSIKNKTEQIDKYGSKWQEYSDYANAKKTQIDEAVKNGLPQDFISRLENEYTNYTNKMIDNMNKQDELAKELDLSKEKTNQDLNDLYSSVSDRLITERVNDFKMNKKEIEQKFKSGEIDVATFQNMTDVYNKGIDRLSTLGSIVADGYGDSKNKDKWDNQKLSIADPLKEYEVKSANSDNYASVVDAETGQAKEVNVYKSKNTFDKDGVSDFDKTHAKIGNVYYEVNYRGPDGKVLSKEDVTNTTKSELDNTNKYGKSINYTAGNGQQEILPISGGVGEEHRIDLNLRKSDQYKFDWQKEALDNAKKALPGLLASTTPLTNALYNGSAFINSISGSIKGAFDKISSTASKDAGIVSSIFNKQAYASDMYGPTMQDLKSVTSKAQFESLASGVFDKYQIPHSVGFGMQTAETGNLDNPDTYQKTYAGRNNFYNINARDSNPNLAFGYDTPLQGIEDFAKFITGNGNRYASPAVQAKLKDAHQRFLQTGDERAYMKDIADAGYAGDQSTYSARAKNGYDRYDSFVADTPAFKDNMGKFKLATQSPVQQAPSPTPVPSKPAYGIQGVDPSRGLNFGKNTTGSSFVDSTPGVVESKMIKPKTTPKVNESNNKGSNKTGVISINGKGVGLSQPVPKPNAVTRVQTKVNNVISAPKVISNNKTLQNVASNVQKFVNNPVKVGAESIKQNVGAVAKKATDLVKKAGSSLRSFLKF